MSPGPPLEQLLVGGCRVPPGLLRVLVLVGVVYVEWEVATALALHHAPVLMLLLLLPSPASGFT